MNGCWIPGDLPGELGTVAPVPTRMMRWRLPLDGTWQRIETVGPVVHLAHRVPGFLDVWSREPEPPPAGLGRQVRVYATGETIPAGMVHLASTADDHCSYHLMERP